MKHMVALFACLLVMQYSFSQSLRKMKAEELSAFISKSEKPLIVSFWATWCASCNEEIPYFISTIRQKYKGQVDLVLVSLDIKSYFPARIAAFAAKRNYDATIVWLNESNADVFCPSVDPAWSGAIPSTLMVNNKRQYRKFYESGISAAQFDKDVEELVGLKR